MSRFLVAGFAALAALDTVAHICFKLAALGAGPLDLGIDWVLRAANQGPLYIAIGCYAATFFIWIRLLRRAPVGPAFAASHVDVVTVLIAAALLLHEHISTHQMVGAGMVVAGIACLALAESRDASAKGDSR